MTLVERLRDCRLCGGTRMLTGMGCPRCNFSINYEAADRIQALEQALEEFLRIDEESGLYAGNGAGSDLVIALDKARAALKQIETP